MQTIEKYQQQDQKTHKTITQAEDLDKATLWLNRTEWMRYLQETLRQPLFKSIQRPEENIEGPKCTVLVIWKTIEQLVLVSQEIVKICGHLLCIEVVYTIKNKSLHKLLLVYLDTTAIQKHIVLWQQIIMFFAQSRYIYIYSGNTAVYHIGWGDFAVLEIWESISEIYNNIYIAIRHILLWSPLYIQCPFPLFFNIFYWIPRLIDHFRLNIIGNRPNIYLPAASSSYRILYSSISKSVSVVPTPTTTKNPSHLKFVPLSIHCWIFVLIYYARRSATINIGMLWFVPRLWLDAGSLVGPCPRIFLPGYPVWSRLHSFWFYTKYCN